MNVAFEYRYQNDTFTAVKREIELLAPGGEIDSIKAAIIAGADAVYCGLDRFNARNRAENMSIDNLYGILKLAHRNNCKVFITLNIMIVENEITALIQLLNRLINTSIDGVIVQDLGLFYLLNKYYKRLDIHASTQLTTHNRGQLQFLKHLSASRVNLSRELTLNEITYLSDIAHENNLLTEVFIHGSNCLSFSGICYMSSLHGGNSGNRGRCSQPCRDQYLTTEAGYNFPLNMKDNSAFTNLGELIKSGADSLKIEGRIKKFHYVYTVVDSWRKHLDSFSQQSTENVIDKDFYKVFNRDFSNGYLTGSIGKNMFIDNPRDHSTTHRAKMLGGISVDNLERAKHELYEEKMAIINTVKAKIDSLSVAKIPLQIVVSGNVGEALLLSVNTPDDQFKLFSKSLLKTEGAQVIDRESIEKRLKAICETAYYIQHLDTDALQSNLVLPFKELTELRNSILSLLNDTESQITPLTLPKTPMDNRELIETRLSVLIDSEADITTCNAGNTTIYYKLPDSFSHTCDQLIDLFTRNEHLVPWFPSVLIGDDFEAAIIFIDKVKPIRLVTDNTGIGFEAAKRNIAWLAGPYINCANSYALLCLKEEFNCAGAFISNELNKQQIKSIKIPSDFELYYSIYQPAILMTSRQCMFHQVTGCEKSKVDDRCISHCEKSATVTNIKSTTFYIKKSSGNYHTIYNAENFLNTAIVNDIPNRFSGFLIDLRAIETATKVLLPNNELIPLFNELLSGDLLSEEKLHRAISPITAIQYKKGV